MNGSEAIEHWRDALLSDGASIPALAIRDEHVNTANAAAHACFGSLRIGMRVEELFDESCGGKLRAALSAGEPATTVELQMARSGEPPAAAMFVVLGLPGEQLLLRSSVGSSYTEKMGQQLVAANAHLADLTRELARSHDAEQRLRAEIEELSRASNAVAERLAETLESLPQGDVSAVLLMIALQAQAMTHADYVALGIGTDPEKPFHPWVSLGMPHELERVIGRNPRPVGVLGLVARTGEVVRAPDVRLHPAFRGLPRHHPPLGSFLGVPVRHRGRPVGNLYLANRPGAAVLTEHDERLMQMLVSKVGTAIETASLYVASSMQRVWLQNVIDQMPDAILLYDERGKRKALNQGVAALACDSPELTDPFSNPAVIEPRDAAGNPLPLDRWPIARVLKRHEVLVREEMHVRRGRNELIPVAVSGGPVRDARGNLSGAMVIIQDISDRKALERLREEWSAVIAHDLRQPVNTIGLAVDILLSDISEGLPESDRRTLERIGSASRRLDRMIDDLLDTSRIESKRLTLECQSVDLRTYLGSVIDDLESVVAGHPVELAVGSDQAVWIDPDRIYQVLGNLITNAVKYGSPDTVIRVESISHDDLVEIVITNHGPGIPPEQLPLLFSRFWRAGGPRAREAPGLGLGLYIARGLVEAHGGRLWGESTPGETTSFHFTLGTHEPAGSAPHRLSPG